MRWVDENRKRHSEVHEKRDDAVFRLKELEARVAEVKRGRRLPDPLPKRFEEIVEYWQKTRATKRSKASDDSIIRAHRLPAFCPGAAEQRPSASLDRTATTGGTWSAFQ